MHLADSPWRHGLRLRMLWRFRPACQEAQDHFFGAHSEIEAMALYGANAAMAADAVGTRYNLIARSVQTSACAYVCIQPLTALIRQKATTLRFRSGHFDLGCPDGDQDDARMPRKCAPGFGPTQRRLQRARPDRASSRVTRSTPSGNRSWRAAMAIGSVGAFSPVASRDKMVFSRLIEH